MYTVPNAFDGQKNEPSHGRNKAVTNPATGDVIGQVPLTDKREVDKIVQAAHKAYQSWSSVPPHLRARLMFKFKELLDRHSDTLATLVSREHGKTHSDSLGEIKRGIEVVEFCCGIPSLLKGSFSRDVGHNVDTHSDRFPLGVCTGITPFNFPVMVPMWMFPVAIACGNTFVLKPSERDPSASIMLWQLFQEAGLPDGVLNVVHGDKEAVDALLEHPLVRAVSFVGSTDIAKYVYAQGSAHGKRVQALGGAKNPMVVMPDADLDLACNALMGAAFGSSGERCMAISLVLPVGEDTANRLVAKLKTKIEALRVGPAAQENMASSDLEIDMGPVISRQHKERILALIQTGIDQGAELVVDGRHLNVSGYENGFFLGGSLFDHVKADMDIYKQEIFGPVLSVARVASFEQAISMVNDHQYGNGTAIFTKDGHCARRYTAQVQVGMVGINVAIPVPVAYHSFGGWKESLFGDHAIYGPEGIHFYTRLKTVTTRWPSSNLTNDPDRKGTGSSNFTFPSMD